MQDWREWLVARPIAHRGLHDVTKGIVENSRAAAAAAVARRYAIECDVQISADAQALVFHDFTLDRLTDETGPVAARQSRDLAGVKLKGSDEGIVDLATWLAIVDGAVPVICEIKSAFDGDLRLAARTAAIAAGYGKPIALKSFDPDVVAFLRREGAALGLAYVPLGLVAEARFDAPEWECLTAAQRLGMETLTHWQTTRPDFLSWHVDNLPHATPSLCRASGMPVMAWTVRSPDQSRRAAEYADQIVFEGFLP